MSTWLLFSSTCVVFGWCLGFVLPAPTCLNTSRPMDEVYTCSELSTASDFFKHMERPQLHPRLTFVLRDSRVENLPSGVFQDFNATVLEFSNVTIEVFGPTEPSFFAGLEDTLEKIIFRDGSSLPQTWGTLKVLRKLKILRLSHMKDLDLSQDMNQLSSSLVAVEVLYSSIVHVDEDWLAQTSGLESLVIRDCNLKVFLRSMLPRPAPKLWNLDLVMNNITQLPKDFGQEFPTLKFLDLQSNQISAIEKECLAPLLTSKAEAIELGDNPLHCDCQIGHLRLFSERVLSATCNTPETLRRRQVHTLTDEELQCDALV
ncbi:toll-like receptor 8 [Ixodes scapularis]|uniref:toll-like receptor 8 n=1 Tax=Ixodes scapularis TaxID=6945 RepID=UPI001A9E6B43|nr:toll-like receptor 8 [Ixodes scapularis]